MDFSHHPKLCTKTQHAQFNKNKPILKLAGLTVSGKQRTRAQARAEERSCRSSPGAVEGRGGTAAALPQRESPVPAPQQRAVSERPRPHRWGWRRPVPSHTVAFLPRAIHARNDPRACSGAAGDTQDRFTPGSAAQHVLCPAQERCSRKGRSAFLTQSPPALRAVPGTLCICVLKCFIVLN